MKIWCISDTHGKHGELIVPECDMVIFAGDCGTARDVLSNTPIVLNFLEWFTNLPIKYKFMIAGNHDTSIERGFVDMSKQDISIRYLEHEGILVDKGIPIKIFGSPYTPSFGNGWAYNVSRSKLHDYWNQIPEDTDILVTHGPPKGILDLTESSADGTPEQCGCKSLLNHVERVKPKFHIFGHIHTESSCLNAGIFKPVNSPTTFINASVLDLKYELHNHGQIIEI